MEMDVTIVRRYRDKLLADPYRPGYHFAIPDDNAISGDPNGAFYADGRYHLMYLYHNSATNAHHWGHISSIDLVHWRHHPDALTAQDGDNGCYSGGAFVDKDRTAYLTFWKFPAKDGSDKGGICIARSRPPYDEWKRMEPLAVESSDNWGVTDISVNGKTVHLASADPSNIWKMGSFYYMQSGNKPVLDAHGRDEGAEDRYCGDWTDLYRSKDLRSWEYVHRFYTNPHTDESWPDKTEDDMCPTFLPLYDAKSGGKLTEKWLQSFISHNKGAQYYVGTLQDEVFTPEVHGRMSWVDKSYFAPEALVDDKGRQIIWAWLLGLHETEFANYGWAGVFSFPRSLWWEHGRLHMAPVEELDLLQYNHKTIPAAVCYNDLFIPVRNGRSFRMKAVIDPGKAQFTGFRVCANSDGDEYTDVYYDCKSGKLVMDTTHSGTMGWNALEEAPFTLEADEKLQLDIFVDKSIVEVYANERQAICRRIFPTDPQDAVGVHMIGGGSKLEQLDIWEMSPANMY